VQCTQRRQRCKKPRPLTNTRYWIHPRFEVGVYVEDPHALPVQILISRHTDGALRAGSGADRDGNLLHGTAPFHVVVATPTLWHSDAAIAGPFHTSKSRQVKGKWPDQPLDHHSGCPS
jgi:hypothetical protein